MKRLVIPLIMCATLLMTNFLTGTSYAQSSQTKWTTESIQALRTLGLSLCRAQGLDSVGNPAYDALINSHRQKLEIITFKTKVIKRYDGANMVEVSSLVKIFNPGRESLEVCIDFLDVDGFAMEQFCRTTKFSADKFQQKVDTTIFRCSRTFYPNGWNSSTARVNTK